jgi:tripartite-type tricarboxylate transporter receptor subunit TctC
VNDQPFADIDLEGSMKLPRRKFLHLATGAAALSALPGVARALDYPTRPVRIVVPYPAGGAPDIIGRLTGEWLSERFGKQFIVDNRPGAASNIGTEVAAHAPADGHTLLVAVSTNAVNASIYTKLSFNFIHDFAPVAGIGATPFVMAFTPSFPAKTFPEFITYAKAHPGKLNMASQGIGTTPHVCGELLMMLTGIDLVHVPYRGNLMPDLLAGQVQFYFSPMAQAIEYIKDGRLRALAVTTAARAALLPDVPAIGEFVPGYEASGWYGIVTPTGTPADVIGRLSTQILAGVVDPNLNARLLTLGVDPMPRPPAEFGKFIVNETEKWAKVIKFAGIKPE